MSRWDAIVVGAGICGLAAAYELARRDARVLVLEADGVGAGQSAGLARIFRIAHADPRLCALALEAERGWRRWEHELGRAPARRRGPRRGRPRARRVLRAPRWRPPGADAHALDRAAIAARIPLLAPTTRGTPGCRSARRQPADPPRAARAGARTVTVGAPRSRRSSRRGGRAPRRTATRCAPRRRSSAPAWRPGRWSRRSASTSASRATHHVRLTYRVREPARRLPDRARGLRAAGRLDRALRARHARRGRPPAARTGRTPTSAAAAAAGSTRAGCRGRSRA